MLSYAPQWPKGTLAMCRCNLLFGACRPRPRLTTVLVQEPCQLRFSQPPLARSDDGVGAIGCRVGLQTTLRLHPSAASYWFCAERSHSPEGSSQGG